jgi:hypothetical protein
VKVCMTAEAKPQNVDTESRRKLCGMIAGPFELMCSSVPKESRA